MDAVLVSPLAETTSMLCEVHNECLCPVSDVTGSTDTLLVIAGS